MPGTVQGRVQIRCKVSLGMFANERGIRIALPNGEAVSALVDKSQVVVDREPNPGEEVDGAVLVSIIGDEEGRVMVNLPQQALTGGTRISVPRSLMESVA